jgi:hypothetical protein
MVLMNAGKASRNQAKTVTRDNTCGGVKKAGIGKGIGTNPNTFVITAMTRSSATVPKSCDFAFVSKTTQTQKYGYKATLG